jgi:hypothetical protein
MTHKFNCALRNEIVVMPERAHEHPSRLWLIKVFEEVERFFCAIKNILTRNITIPPCIGFGAIDPLLERIQDLSPGLGVSEGRKHISVRDHSILSAVPFNKVPMPSTGRYRGKKLQCLC